MAYFTSSFTGFFKELEKNNTTEWFNDNRRTYEKEVKKPFALLVTDMIDRIREYEPEVNITSSDAIMRINKDIRFSKDKTPYNTHVAANISKFGKKDKSYPGFYFQLSHEGIKIFGGSYMTDSPTLNAIRAQITGNPKSFASICNDPEFKKLYGSIQGEQNKKLPPEFKDAVGTEPLIANKQFYYNATLEPSLLLSEKLPDVLMEYYKAGSKLNTFLKSAY